jgi:two-component system, NtrC family, sensor histidine kinase HydH
MERLLGRLRNMVGDERRPKVPLDLRAPLTDAVEFMQAVFDEKGIMVKLVIGDTLFTVVGDHEALEQLFINLLMNAHEATPPRGSVCIEMRHDTGNVSVSVSDTGPGIRSDLIDQIFEPFFSTKQRGSGLGLAIAAGVAQSHNAVLSAGNQTAGGAVFTVVFPLASVQTSVALDV